MRILITIDENDPLGQFIMHMAQQVDETPEQVAIDLARTSFESTVRKYHVRFMAGEFTHGGFADLLGIERLDLIHLLDDLALPATNI